MRSKWTKKILKKLQAQAISNHDEFKNGEAVNNLGRPPKPLHPGRRQGKSAKSKEVERQLFEKAKSKLSASAPKQPKVIEAKKLDLHVPRDKIAVWVPSGMEPKDITIESKPWVKVNAIVNADIILCKANIQRASLGTDSTTLCAKLYRQRMVDLEWMNSNGQRGQSVAYAPRATGVKRTPIDVYFTPAAKDKHHSAVSVLESFSANAIVSDQKKKRTQSVYTVKLHYDLDAFFSAVKKPTMSASTLAFTFIVCTSVEVHELRELASFTLGCRKDSSLIERSVTSFHAFVACI